MELPESFQLFGGLWWLIHIIAVGLVFFLGYVIGRTEGEKAGRRSAAEDEESRAPE